MSKEEKELIELEARIQEQYDAVQEKRKSLIDTVLAELIDNKIIHVEARRKLLTLVNMVEYQAVRSMSKEQENSKGE